MSEDILLVLYSGELKKNSYCLYYGGVKEADSELPLIREEDPTVIERGRIWIEVTETWTAKAKAQSPDAHAKEKP